MKIMYGLVAAFSLAAANVAQALPVTFDLSADSNVVLDAGCLGCDVSVTLNPLLDDLSATLTAGQDWEFDFFTLHFSGLGIGGGSIYANLGFDAPIGAPDALGSGVGGFFTSFLFTAGGLLWDAQPGLFTLSNGTSYSVEFQNLLDFTEHSSVNVGARLTLHSEPNAAVPVVGVPEPGLLGLFGLGLLGIGVSARRRRRSAQ